MELAIPKIEPEEFQSELVLSFGLSPDAADILTFTTGIEFNATPRNAQVIDFRIKNFYLTSGT
jgi:hypothetical protein